MATWIAHMRVAEHFMNIDGRLNNIDFLVGNIAPDCGVPKEDGNGFMPDKSITHWKVDDPGTKHCIENFKNKYIKRENEHFNFYLGYYFHLLTDNTWKYFPLKGIENVNGKMQLDKDITWEMVKKDWYGQDHVYLQNNPESVFFTMFRHIKEYPNRFLDYFPYDAFTRQIKKMIDSYLTAKEDAGRDFSYLTKADMDSFVNSAIHLLEKFYNKI